MKQTDLRSLIADSFNKSELRSLCFDLDINFENLQGETLEDKSRELITYCKRQGRLEDLISRCRELRPQKNWPGFRNSDSEPDTEPENELSNARRFQGNLDVSVNGFGEKVTEILQQPRKAMIYGVLLVFLFTLGAVSDAFGAWSGIKAVFSPEVAATHMPTYTPTHTPTSTPTPTMTPTLEMSSLCQFRLGEIITSRKFLVPGGTANITVEYSNPSNQVLIFH